MLADVYPPLGIGGRGRSRFRAGDDHTRAGCSSLKRTWRASLLLGLDAELLYERPPLRGISLYKGTKYLRRLLLAGENLKA